MKIRMILYEKGIDFEQCEIHTRADGEALRKLNPRAEVPALVDGDTVLFDSKVIAEYLEETRPKPALLPEGSAARAACRAVELYADTELDAALLALALFRFFRRELAEQQPDACTKAEESVRGHFALLDRRLEGRGHFVGEFSRADIAVVPHVTASAFLGLPPGDDTPRLAAWHARVNERDSVKRTTEEAMASIGVEPEEPFFDTDRLHWRSDRIEQLIRIGLGPWLLEELESGRAFVPPGPS